ncbi:response regulator [soil metagenome]
MDGKVVLVVEDNSDELMIYSTLLRHHGYEIITATHYQAALEIASERQPDLAIVDVNLGHASRDGCDLISAFRRNPATANMAVVAHTAFGDVYRRSLEKAGCNGIVHKPSNPTVLVREVERLLGRGPSEPGPGSDRRSAAAPEGGSGGHSLSA